MASLQTVVKVVKSVFRGERNLPPQSWAIVIEAQLAVNCEQNDKNAAHGTCDHN